MLALIILASPGCRSPQEQRPLFDNPGHLPYRAELVLRAGLQPASGQDAFADVDGDGDQEWILASRPGLVTFEFDGHQRVSLDQFNLPAEDIGTGPWFAWILAPYDPDADGRSEVVAVTRGHDDHHWTCWAIDLRSRRALGRVALPEGEDRFADGAWDGSYEPAAVLPMAGRTRPVVLLTCNVLHDVDGRGILAVDPLDGAVVGRFQCGGPPARPSLKVADLDGDGVSEVVFATSSPDNLHGNPWHGTSDDSTRVFVLGNDLRLRWTRAVTGAHGQIVVDVSEPDGDGRRTIVAAAAQPEAPHGRMIAWTGAGEVLADTLVGDGAYVAAAWTGPGPSGRPRVLAIHNDGAAELAELDRGAFTVTKRATVGPAAAILLHDDVVAAEPGREFVLRIGGRVAVVGEDLRPLAVTPESSDQAGLAALWRPTADRTVLEIAFGTGGGYVLEPAPRDHRLAAFAISAGGLLATGGLFIRRRRAGRGRGVETDPAVLKQLRLQLLDALQRRNHGRIGLLSGLRGLIWTVEAAHVLGAVPGGDGGDAVPGAGQVIKAAGAFRAETLPRLKDVLALARRTAAPDHVVVTAQEALDDVGALLDGVVADGTIHPDLLPRLRRAGDELETSCQRLLRSIHDTFACNLPDVVHRVLAAHVQALRDVGIAMDVATDGAPDTTVLVDDEALAYALDNLVDNAIRAMDGASRRVLRIAWSTTATGVEVTVADSGWGMPGDIRERIFEEGFSTRAGGGQGLARTRRDFRLHDATIVVADSRPGLGTTFLLRFLRPTA